MAISTIGANGLTTPLPAANLGTPSAINLSNATSLAKAALPTGSVLQVVSANTNSSTVTTSTTFVTTGFSASITPTSASSKILAQVFGGVARISANNQVNLTIFRGGTNLGDTFRGLYQAGNYATTGGGDFPVSLGYYDSPATTSSTTYTVYVRASGGTATFEVDASTCTIVLMEIAA